MCALVENLLSIARADAGAETISLQAVMVRELFLRLEREWRTPMRDALLDLRIESGAREFAVLADPAGINRLLTILLENVRNYTPPGGDIPLSATCVGATVTLAVRDKGIGMAPEHPPRIFDRFYRGSQASDSSARQQAPPRASSARRAAREPRGPHIHPDFVPRTRSPTIAKGSAESPQTETATFATHKRNVSKGPVAQRLEQGTHNPLVGGSNPSGPTIESTTYSDFPTLHSALVTWIVTYQNRAGLCAGWFWPFVHDCTHRF